MQSIAERAWEKVHCGKRILSCVSGSKKTTPITPGKKYDMMISKKGTLLSDKKEEQFGFSFCMARGKALFPDFGGVKR